MFNLRLCDAATIRYSQFKFDICIFVAWTISIFSSHCCKCNNVWLYRRNKLCGNACHGPHNDSFYSGSEHSQFNSPRLSSVKRASPTHGGRWLSQTNYDALMSHHTTGIIPQIWTPAYCFFFFFFFFFGGGVYSTSSCEINRHIFPHHPVSMTFHYNWRHLKLVMYKHRETHALLTKKDKTDLSNHSTA